MGGPAVVCVWIEAEKEHRSDLNVVLACPILGVSRSEFYAWRARLNGPPPPRQHQNRKLLGEIRRAHTGFPAYGFPRVCHELRHRGRMVGVNRVVRLIRENGIRAC
ncbi:MAG: IS3 family transposase [Thermoanaerobaculales bacterium]